MNYLQTNLAKLFLFLIICASWPMHSNAQCPDDRLVLQQYAYERDTVYYGSNTTVLGDTLDLYMDIYQPANDTFSKRPVIIFAFGGGFVSGERNDFLMTALCQDYAERGFVAATMDYRLFPDEELGSPDSSELIDANIKAVSDMKAAIRFFRESADSGNPYRVDPEFIVVGGYSAGAFTALHHSYLNEEDEGELPPNLVAAIEGNGGFEGNTGDTLNQSYSSDVNACLNFAGALFDTILVDEGEVPLFSFHGTEDMVVPIATGQSVNTVRTMGSALITERAINVNVPAVFYAVQGAGHGTMWAFVNQLNAFFNETNEMLSEMYCGTTTSNVYSKQELQPLRTYPNPTSGVLYLDFGEYAGPEQLPFKLISLDGKMMKNGIINAYNAQLNFNDLSPGMYILKISTYESRKVLIK